MDNVIEKTARKEGAPAPRRAPAAPGAARTERKLETRDLPWGYGRDRVTAMPVDPDRLFVYWEVTDEAIAAARKALGKRGEHAWPCLRVYDTSGRLFDGTNAHGYFDHDVDRNDRQWFFHIGKPTSEAIVEIGMKSDEGYFARIARSRRVVFPRREPAAWQEPEWLTVLPSGHVESAGRGQPGAAGGPGAGPGGGGGHGGGPPPGGAWTHFEPAGTWAMRFGTGVDWRKVFETEGHEVWEWVQHFGEELPEEFYQHSWEGPLSVTSWKAGPFSYPVEMPAPQREQWVGKARMYKVGDKTHVLYGPWQVVIRNLGAHYGRKVLARWEMYRTWVTNEFREVEGGGYEAGPPGASELRLRGASERRWLGASELRVGGASEIYYLGASELRIGGASEARFAGASEYVMRGSSERRFAGASELQYGGASERLLQGASEGRWKGASERLIGGASERRLGGGSEDRLGGGSEGRLGASEGRLQARPEPGAPEPGNGGGAYPVVPSSPSRSKT